MITITNLSKNFTQRTLFENVSLSVYPQEKIGLTGPNGSGKTTLFAIILGELEATAGNVQMQKGLQIGYLPQEAALSSQRTLLEEVTAGNHHINALLKEKRRLEETNKADNMRYGDIQTELEQLGIYELEHRAEKILSGLGFEERAFHRPVTELSGGWQMRALLAKLLVYPYDLLLLDEPTNYLDLAATFWLKDFLSAYKGTFIVISHDKVFLNDITNYTIVLENGQMMKVKGNYQEYEEQKTIQQRGMEKRQKVVEKKRQQLERFTQRFHAQPNRAAAVRNKRKQIERLENIELSTEQKSIKEFEFPPVASSGYNVLTLRDIHKSYGDKSIYEGVDLELTRGQKVCLVGPNGAGKSTLLKMMAGILSPDSGEVRLGHNVERGYFSQTRLDVLQPNRNVLDELAAAVRGSYPAAKMRSLLGLFSFRGEDVFKPVSVLSGGEKSRLILAKLLINPPNLMFLDEPTTHLDIDGVEALTHAFQAYQGTLCFISHDLFFVREVADCIIEVTTGRLKVYPGRLAYYLDKKAQGQTLIQRQETSRSVMKSKNKDKNRKNSQSATGREPGRLKAVRAQHQQTKKRLAQIRKDVQTCESRMKELETESYVKARVLGNAYGKDPALLKEYGKRLKEIPGLLREEESRLKALEQEKQKLSRLVK